MLEIQPLREVYQRAGTREAAAKAFKSWVHGNSRGMAAL
jgi:hypothetical protein